MLPLAAITTLGSLAVKGLSEWSARRPMRRAYYDAAYARSRAIGKPLLVIGDPDGGVTHQDYGYGDVCADMTGCPLADKNGSRGIKVDLGEGLPLPSDSHVVFCCYVLELVPNLEKAYQEIMRVAGGRTENVYILSLHPDEVAAYTYPGTRWAIREAPHGAPNGRLVYEPIARRGVIDARVSARGRVG